MRWVLLAVLVAVSACGPRYVITRAPRPAPRVVVAQRFVPDPPPPQPLYAPLPPLAPTTEPDPLELPPAAADPPKPPEAAAAPARPRPRTRVSQVLDELKEPKAAPAAPSICGVATRLVLDAGHETESRGARREPRVT